MWVIWTLVSRLPDPRPNISNGPHDKLAVEIIFTWKWKDADILFYTQTNTALYPMSEETFSCLAMSKTNHIMQNILLLTLRVLRLVFKAR